MQDVINLYKAFKTRTPVIHGLICENSKALRVWVVLAETFSIFNLNNKCSQG